MSESQEISAERQWARQVIEEYRNYENPPVSPDINIVWVISGHSTYDTLQSSFPKINPPHPEGTLYRVDDQERINFGVNLVRQVTALRLRKNKSEITKEDIVSYGPILFYNGTTVQNENLRNAIQNEIFPIPSENILIGELSEDDDPRKANTRTQFEEFPQELLESAVKGNGKIAVVSHRYQLSRIARTINAHAVLEKQPLWEKVNVVYFVSDKSKEDLPKDAKSVTKRAIGIRRAVIGEGGKINRYSKEGTTNTKPRDY